MYELNRLALVDQVERGTGHEMNLREARKLGERIAALVQTGQVTQAHGLLDRVLDQGTPFPLVLREAFTDLSTEQRALATGERSR